MNSSFGSKVAIDGDTLAVAKGNQGGAVYVYRYLNSVWTFEFVILPNQNATGFANSIDIYGDTIIVGAQFERAVYVYGRDSDGWSLRQRIASTVGGLFASFGRSVSIDGDRFVVGASGELNEGGVNSGAAYIFRREPEGWVEEARLVDSEPGTSTFGTSVALSGNDLIVGAVGDLGFASMFVRKDGMWVREARFIGEGSGPDGRYGLEVAIDSDSAVVAANGARPVGNFNSGAVYIYERNEGAWTHTKRLFIGAEDSAFRFGDGVGISGDRIVVGSSRAQVFGMGGRGAAFLYAKEGSDWNLHYKLIADDGLVSDYFGSSVAIQGNRVFSGAPGVDIDGVNNRGAVYFFLESPRPPRLHAKSDSGISDSDNVTNATSLVFDIDGITPGSTVEFLRDGVVLESRVVDGQSAVFIDSAAENYTYQYQSRQIVNGEVGSFSPPMIVTVDRLPPIVSINQRAGQPDPTTSDIVMFDISFDQQVFGFTEEDISLASSTIDLSNVDTFLAYDEGSTTASYRVSDIVSNGQFVRATILTGAVTDRAGNVSGPSVSTDNTVTVDNVRPSVAVTQAAGQPDPAFTQPINFTAQFSETVYNFNTSSLILSGTAGLANAQAVITGSGSTYNIAISNVVANGGTVRLSLQTGAGVDAAGNLSYTLINTDNQVTLSNRILDGGFETTASNGFNPHWTSFSTRFGTALCRTSFCGTGGGTAAPRNGDGWVWFDGSDMTEAEFATVSQQVQFPPSGTAILSYHLKIGAVRAPALSILRVKINGLTVQTINEPETAETAFTERLVDLSEYSNGQVHNLTFEYFRPSGTPSDNFVIDDVLLIVEEPASPSNVAPFDFDGDGKTDVS
ncbi:MAG TPA: hypothetical protein DEP46_06715, partial [Blastocatellia bacterium]|nr:hypothetical protein [Blastocatellia bacterium]